MLFGKSSGVAISLAILALTSGTAVASGQTGPAEQPSPETVAKLIAQLGAAEFRVREHASYQLEKLGSPVAIQASYPGTGEGGTTVVFDPVTYKQRPGLLLLNGVVYTAWSSHCDGGYYHGWLIGYDATTLRQVAIYNNTPNGNQASFWAGGAAPAVDDADNIYLVGGNGSFNYAFGGPDLGESYIKLSTRGGLAVDEVSLVRRRGQGC